MTKAEEIYQQAIELDPSELSALVERLWLALPVPEVDASSLKIADERRADLDAGRSHTVPWSEVRERMFKRARGG